MDPFVNSLISNRRIVLLLLYSHIRMTMPLRKLYIELVYKSLLCPKI